VRAHTKDPVEVLTYPRGDFLRIIGESPITAEALEKVVEERLKEHAAGGRMQDER
jgi:CRP-like cAMP-binding protein